MPLLFPFRKISQAPGSGFGGLVSSSRRLLRKYSCPVRSTVGRNRRKDFASVLLIPFLIVIGFVVWLFGLNPLAVRSLPELSSMNLPAYPLAGSTKSLPFTNSFFGGGILWRIFVAPDAKPLSRGVPSGDIHSERDGFKVFRVDAFRDAAKMIQRKPWGYWTLYQFVGEPMGHMALAFKSQMPITGFVNGSDPKPASRSLQNPGVKRFVDGSRAHGLNQYAAMLARMKWEQST